MTSSSRNTMSSRKRSAAERLIGLLGNQSGRDISALCAKLGWQPHSVRAALSRLRKTGVEIEKFPPGRKGAAARYRITSANQESTR